MKFLLKTRLQVNQIRWSSTNSGVLGTNRIHANLNSNASPIEQPNSSIPTITDPYLIYKSLVNLKKIDPDPHQLALMRRLGMLSQSLQSYQPDLNDIKIKKLVRELEIRYNKQGKNSKDTILGYTVGWFKEREKKKLKNQVIRVLNDYDELNSDKMKKIPKGLLINGEVGCGKTMLMDIFADTLPVQGKWRVHWGVFIQWVMKEIELISVRKRDGFIQENHPLLNLENEFILYEVASRLINKCHVLILDEFMLPDIASAKIINILFTNYFKLGGVLIASSNRLPEELYSGSVNKTSMGTFEGILRSRCDVWDMLSDKDYRSELKDDDISDEKWLIIGNSKESNEQWENLVKKYIVLDKCQKNVPLFKSYGREVIIPYMNDTVAYFDFKDIVKDSTHGPSDFISIANRFPMIIIDNIPILSIKKKNNARILITFIDAIYDSKCNLIVKTETEPEHLFFPDIRDDSPTRFKCTPLEDGPNPVCLMEGNKKLETEKSNYDQIPTTTQELQDIEMFSDTQLDMLNPHRPNFATYEDDNKDYNIHQDEEKEQVNFTDIKKFTGEDEMFAYKRAVSRINEMTKSIRWRENSWIPLHESVKLWEISETNTINEKEKFGSLASDQSVGTVSQRKDAPKFKEYNFWSMGKWDNKKKTLKDEVARKWVRGASDE